MYNETDRTRKVGEQIQRELSDIIRRDMKDPRATWITIQAVKVSKDFSHARVYVCTLKDDHADAIVHMLTKASGFLRYELGKRMKSRTIPQLHFVYDESVENGNRLASLIDQAVKSDQVKREQD
ncbi:MAG: 30S ribosome-binding factor RbfA [Gammaproteobacteria bacterium]|nr:30S ribosome-binding factor RbfA [Gammaproteobacteria bacterium]